jgi:peptidoglycan biosynthesis protein MviN/MurJ (putative lipid II flippase)
VAFSFAFRMAGLVHLPASALVTVTFPVLSEAGALRKAQRFRMLLAKTMRGVLILAVPCVVILSVLRHTVVEFLIGGSAMSSSAVALSSQLFRLLLIGAPTGAFIAMFQRVLAIRGAVWMGAAGSGVTLVVAIVGLRWTNDAWGVAILWDIALWANVAVLFATLICLDSRLARLFPLSFLSKLAFAAISSGACAWAASATLNALGWTLTAILIVSAVAAAGAAIASSYWARISEARDVIGYATAQWRRAWAFVEVMARQ